MREIKKGDWVLCPLTADDVDDPTIVAKVDRVEGNVLHIIVSDGTVSMPVNYCKVVHVQRANKVDIEETMNTMLRDFYKDARYGYYFDELDRHTRTFVNFHNQLVNEVLDGK